MIGPASVEDLADWYLTQSTGYSLEVVDDELVPGDEEAYTDFATGSVVFRSSTWDEVVEGKVRARFTAAHEIGHVVVHRKQMEARARELLEYTRAARLRTVKIPRYSNPEWQANSFAGFLLVPPPALSVFCSDPANGTNRHELEEEMAHTFGISLEAAHWRMETYTRKAI